MAELLRQLDIKRLVFGCSRRGMLHDLLKLSIRSDGVSRIVDWKVQVIHFVVAQTTIVETIDRDRQIGRELAAVPERKLMLIRVAERGRQNGDVRWCLRAIGAHALAVIWSWIRQNNGRRYPVRERDGTSHEVEFFRFAKLSLDEVIVDAVTAPNHIFRFLERIPGETEAWTKIILVATCVWIAFVRDYGMAR